MGFFSKLFGKAATPPSGTGTTVNRRLVALNKFEQTIESWEYDQARLAVAIVGALVWQDHGPLETLYGKGATVEYATSFLKVGNMRLLHESLREIFAELGIDPETDEDI